jgi:hypothetical protein
MRTPGNRNRVAGLVGIATGVALLVGSPGAAGAAHRGGGHDGRAVYRNHPVFVENPGHARKAYRYGYGSREVRYVVVRQPRAVFVRPVYADYFIVRRPRFVVVRPVPYWPMGYGNSVSARIGVNIGHVQLGFGFQRTEPYYGCNFCDAYFSDYGAWEAHVAGCAHRSEERVICEPWDAGDVDAFRDGAAREWERSGGGY